MDENKVFSIFNFRSNKNQSISENNELYSNFKLQESPGKNSVTEVDHDDPPILLNLQKFPSDIIDIGDINIDVFIN